MIPKKQTKAYTTAHCKGKIDDLTRRILDLHQQRGEWEHRLATAAAKPAPTKRPKPAKPSLKKAAAKKTAPKAAPKPAKK